LPAAELLRGPDPPADAGGGRDVPPVWPAYGATVGQGVPDTQQLAAAGLDAVVDLAALTERVSIDRPLRLHDQYQVTYPVECDNVKVADRLTVAALYQQALCDQGAGDASETVCPPVSPSAECVPELAAACWIGRGCPQQCPLEADR